MLSLHLEMEDVLGLRRRARLRSHQELRIGRSQWADFVCPDPALAEIHFRIYTDDVAGYVELCDPEAAILLNREAAVAAVLADGDEISAGSARFRIGMKGDRPERAVPVPQTREKPKQRVDHAPASLFSMNPCRSGLNRFRGRSDQTTPAQFAEALWQLGNVFLIVDFSKLQMVAPPNSREIVETSSRASRTGPGLPRLVSADGTGDWPRYLEQGWGQNAVVTLLGDVSLDQLQQQLSSCCVESSTVPDGGMHGVCWPSVLNALLENDAPFAARLFEGLNAVLIEVIGAPDQWQLFGKEELGSALIEAGFRESTSESAASA